MAWHALAMVQTKMKGWYDRKACIHNFQSGDQVLVLFTAVGSSQGDIVSLKTE